MYGLYVSASGAQAMSDRLEVLSNNIANSSTAGFKREFSINAARPAEAIVEGRDFVGSGTMNNVGGGVRMVETITDFQPGAFKATGNKSDMALTDTEGDMFFVVEKDRKQFLTRAGNFIINRFGTLQTPEGHDVMSTDGAPVKVNPAYPIQVTSDGRVVQTQVGTDIPLAIEKPRSLGDLVKVGDTMFSSLAQTTPVEPHERSVKQGVLEHSGTNPITEMMEMIQVTRGYEANVKMMQHQDGATGQLLDRVLRQS